MDGMAGETVEDTQGSFIGIRDGDTRASQSVLLPSIISVVDGAVVVYFFEAVSSGDMAVIADLCPSGAKQPLTT